MRTLKVLLLCITVLMVVNAVCFAAAPPPKKTVRGQWWGPAPNPTITATGVVVSTGPDQIMVNLQRGPQGFIVTPKTEIIIEGKRAGLGDLRQGDQCVIRFQVAPNGPPIALRIEARKAATPKTPSATGSVASITTDRIVLNTPHGPLTLAVTSDTQIMVFGRSAGLADVKVGQRAEVNFRPVDGGVGFALRINVPKPRVAGVIDAINGNVLTVRERDVVWNVTVPDSARIVCRTYHATFGDLKIGYHVSVNGSTNGQNAVAEVVEYMPIMFKGVVTAVDGNQITVATTERTIMTGVLSEATMILVRPRASENRPGTASDIKVESPVDIGGTLTEGGPYQGGTMQLLVVDVFVGK